MYYFFLNKKKREIFRSEYERVWKAMDDGKTPVYSEMRNQRTVLLELIPSTILNGTFLIITTWLVSLINIPDLIKVAVVLLMNNTSGALSYSLFVSLKHKCRLRFLRKLGIEPSEKAIAVLESLEYQSV